jgi:BioD-like phosphotransacetylase family protein
MEQDTLTEILGVEKVIRDKLEAEREQAGAWREQARSTIEQAHQTALERLREAALQDDAAARQAASERAAAIVLEATAAAGTIERLQDDDLRPYVRQHIACIAPGMSRDH